MIIVIFKMIFNCLFREMGMMSNLIDLFDKKMDFINVISKFAKTSSN